MVTQGNTQQLQHYLRLASLPSIGIKRILQTSEHLRCSLDELIDIKPKKLVDLGWNQSQLQALQGQNQPLEKRISQALSWLNSGSNRHILPIYSSLYPEQFYTMDSPPLVIFAEGNLELLTSKMLAIVGTRAPTQYAYDVINSLMPELSLYKGLSTVSGLALGVDAICHRASLANKIPTIGVLGCGIDIVYPKRHSQLYSDIKQQGLLISEFLPGSQPKAFHFPRRNRLISGLASAVLITEGKIKSGSMVTVKCALEQNKEILAVPCSMFNPNGELAHILITEGAVPVRSASDIMQNVPDFFDFNLLDKKIEKSCNQSLATDPLLDSVGDSATSVDLIAKRTGTPVVDVLTQLLEYELRGLVASTAEGYVKLRG
ncbi:DNA-processing protein DprA [Glaciecola sp. 1036]|uniref:DNA-processing protein DprA n=1 Tax=Alteromonadaceae TaxID=72275 RepID=UPI003D0097E8